MLDTMRTKVYFTVMEGSKINNEIARMHHNSTASAACSSELRCLPGVVLGGLSNSALGRGSSICKPSTPSSSVQYLTVFPLISDQTFSTPFKADHKWTSFCCCFLQMHGHCSRSHSREYLLCRRIHQPRYHHRSHCIG